MILNMTQTLEVDGRIKFLVVADESAESQLAAFFAGRRARNSNARISVLHVLEPPEFGHWASVAETMRAAARDNAERILKEISAEITSQLSEAPEHIIREGDLFDELRKLINEDREIALLFLGVADGANGPGPLVSAVTKDPASLSARPIPIVLVPGAASREELRALAG